MDHPIDEPDELLIDLIKTGDDAAFTALYNRYKALLTVHAYKKLGNFEDAKEIIQDIFSGMWANRGNLPTVKNGGAYLYTLVRNRVLNHIEHANIEARYAASFHYFVSEKNYVTDLLLRERELEALIEREIAALPPKMQEVFVLSRKAHLSNKEIAEKLNISEFTVKNHIKAASKLLRMKLGVEILALLSIFFHNQ